MTESTVSVKCSPYTYNDGADERDLIPCKCPICGAFLKWQGQKPICNKCGTELLVIPDKDEETGQEMDFGKICPISNPKKESKKRGVR